MPYEVFTRKFQRSGTPAISFTPIGTLRFNHSATQVLQKEVIEHVLLMWDAGEHKMALKTTSSKKDPRAYRIHISGKGNGSGFSAKTFMDHFGINYSERTTLPVDIKPNHELLIEVQLPEGMVKKKSQPKIVERGKVAI